jgi:alpha/beta superfamily hydrolase
MILRIIRSKEISKLQCLQDRREINGDNMNNIRHEGSRHFRNKKRDHLKDKINELATRDLYRRIN